MNENSLKNLEKNKCRFAAISSEEASILGKKGAEIANKNRIQRKTYKELLDIAQYSQNLSDETKKKLEDDGFEANEIYKKAVAVNELVNNSMTGNINALNKMEEIDGQYTERDLARKELDSESDRNYKTEKLKNENLKLELETKKLELMIEAAKKGIIDKDSLPTFVLDYKD